MHDISILSLDVYNHPLIIVFPLMCVGFLTYLFYIILIQRRPNNNINEDCASIRGPTVTSGVSHMLLHTLSRQQHNNDDGSSGSPSLQQHNTIDDSVYNNTPSWVNFGLWYNESRDNKDENDDIAGAHTTCNGEQDSTDTRSDTKTRSVQTPTQSLPCYTTACENLACLAGDALFNGIVPHTYRVLDVGMGCGDSLLLWHNKYEILPQNITGLTYSPLQATVAQQKCAHLGIPTSNILCGDASDLLECVKSMKGSKSDLPKGKQQRQWQHNPPTITPNADSNVHNAGCNDEQRDIKNDNTGANNHTMFDGVVCIDAAYHLQPDRQRFLHAAAHLSNRLVLVDIIFPTQVTLLTKLLRIMTEMIILPISAIPSTNAVTAQVLQSQLLASGFKQVHCTSIGNRTFPGFFAFIWQLWREQRWYSKHKWTLIPFLLSGWGCGFLQKHGIMDMVVVVAER